MIKQHLKRGLQKQISLQIGERLMQLLMNDSIGLPKFISRGKIVYFLGGIMHILRGQIENAIHISYNAHDP